MLEAIESVSLISSGRGRAVKFGGVSRFAISKSTTRTRGGLMHLPSASTSMIRSKSASTPDTYPPLSETQACLATISR
jgi:hypothetical protein